MRRLGARIWFLILTSVTTAACLACSQNMPISTADAGHPAKHHEYKGSGWGGKDPQEPKFLIAIRDGNLKAVQQIAAGMKNLDWVYYSHEEGESGPAVALSPVALAVASEHPDIVAFLLNRGASANFAAPNDDPPLMDAAFLDDLKSARLLLQYGANVNDENKDGETALLNAAGNADGTRMLRTLIDAGADVQAIDHDGHNALMLAAWAHNLKAVDFLMKKGIDPCASNDNGETALELAKGTLKTDPAQGQIISMLRKWCQRDKAIAHQQ
jgi:hypothetical protein